MAAAQVAHFRSESTSPVAPAYSSNVVGGRSSSMAASGPSSNNATNVPKSTTNNSEGITALMLSCQQGRSEDVQKILRKKGNAAVKDRTRTGKVALHFCAESGSASCFDYILAADPQLINAQDEEGYTPLHLSVINGNKDIVRKLITAGADLNCLDNESHSLVHWATVCGEVDILELLLSNKAPASTPDIHLAHPLHYAAQMCGSVNGVGSVSRTRVQSTVYGVSPKKGLQILKRLIQCGCPIDVRDQDGRQPLLWAASAGSGDAILLLVNAGAKVDAEDKDGLSALHCAASRGHTDCLETLIGLCGAEVDVIDNNGCTALFYAVTLGHADCTELLLNYGAEPNRQDRKGRTPGHCGAAKGQLETLKLLSKHGGNLWLRNVRGDLPLHEAVLSRRKDLVMWLLSQRPDAINLPNNDGRCPIHLAALNNNVEMVKILIDYRADVNLLMRSGKGAAMTPLDAAIHKGNSAVAKFLQLHGGLPSNSLNDAALHRRMTRSIEGQISPASSMPGSQLGSHHHPSPDDPRTFTSPEVFDSNAYSRNAYEKRVGHTAGPFIATSTPIMDDGVQTDGHCSRDMEVQVSDGFDGKHKKSGRTEEDKESNHSHRKSERRRQRKSPRHEDQETSSSDSSPDRSSNQLTSRASRKSSRKSNKDGSRSISHSSSRNSAEKTDEKGSSKNTSYEKNETDNKSRSKVKQKAITPQGSSDTLLDNTMMSEKFSELENVMQSSETDVREEELGPLTDGKESRNATKSPPKKSQDKDNVESENEHKRKSRSEKHKSKSRDSSSKDRSSSRKTPISPSKKSHSKSKSKSERSLSAKSHKDNSRSGSRNRSRSRSAGDSRSSSQYNMKSDGEKDRENSSATTTTGDPNSRKSSVKNSESRKTSGERASSFKDSNIRPPSGKISTVSWHDEAENEKSEDVEESKTPWERSKSKSKEKESKPHRDRSKSAEHRRRDSKSHEKESKHRDRSKSAGHRRHEIKSKDGESPTRERSKSKKALDNNKESSKSPRHRSKSAEHRERESKSKGESKHRDRSKSAGHKRRESKSNEGGESPSREKSIQKSKSVDKESKTEHKRRESKSNINKNESTEKSKSSEGQVKSLKKSNSTESENQEKAKEEDPSRSSSATTTEGISEKIKREFTSEIESIVQNADASKSESAPKPSSESNENKELSKEEEEELYDEIEAGKAINLQEAARRRSESLARDPSRSRSRSISQSRQNSEESFKPKHNNSIATSKSKPKTVKGGRKKPTTSEEREIQLQEALLASSKSIRGRGSVYTGRRSVVPTRQSVKRPSNYSTRPTIENDMTSHSTLIDSGISDHRGLTTSASEDHKTRLSSKGKSHAGSKRKVVTRRPGSGSSSARRKTIFSSTPKQYRAPRTNNRFDTLIVHQMTMDNVDGDDTNSTSTRGGSITSEEVGESPRRRRPNLGRPRSKLTFSRGEDINDSRLSPRPRKNVDVETPISVTQAMQASMRKYNLERTIFQELLELKRLQIRAGKANEQLLVKRVAENYRKAGYSVNFRDYDGPYTFRNFEKYLYDQLRLLQSNRRLLPRFAPSDDIEKLSMALKKMNSTKLPYLEDAERSESVCDNIQCSHTTHRCHHAAHAYTGVPCAAYIGSRKNGFLPKVNPIKAPGPTQKDALTRTAMDNSSRNAMHDTMNLSSPMQISISPRTDTQSPITLEVQQGDNTQVFTLPTKALDPSKNYYVSLSIKPNPTQTPSSSPIPPPMSENNIISRPSPGDIVDDGSISAPPPPVDDDIEVQAEVDRDKHNKSM